MFRGSEYRAGVIDDVSVSGTESIIMQPQLRWLDGRQRVTDTRPCTGSGYSSWIPRYRVTFFNRILPISRVCICTL